MNVDVYRNLHKNCWSIRDRSTGRVWGHSQQYVVNNGTFVVQPAGRERVLEEQKKNVHAFVRGGAGTTHFSGNSEWRNKFTEPVTYNPYTAAHFTDKDGNPVEGDKILHPANQPSFYGSVYCLRLHPKLGCQPH